MFGLMCGVVERRAVREGFVCFQPCYLEVSKLSVTALAKLN